MCFFQCDASTATLLALTFSKEVSSLGIHLKLSSLMIRVDRIYLGKQTFVQCRADMFLIKLQTKPWTWVSTLFILVCIGLPSALSWSGST